MTVYSFPAVGEPLTQGDVIDDCPVLTIAPPDDDPAGPLEERRFTSRVIVLTQACDLAQKKSAFVVVAPVYTAQQVVDSGVMKAAQIRDQVRSGRTFGWYYLAAAPGMSESVVEFRQLYTVHHSVLDQLVAAGHRVCRLATPFREHLAQHFAVTYMRIALPEPYPTAP